MTEIREVMHLLRVAGSCSKGACHWCRVCLVMQ